MVGMGGQPEYRLVDLAVFAVFLLTCLFSMYICYKTLFVGRDYLIFSTEEEVEAALESTLIEALVNFF
jgi:hypothetical protein